VVIVKGNFNYMEIKDFLFKVGISQNAQEYSLKKTYLVINQKCKRVYRQSVESNQ